VVKIISDLIATKTGEEWLKIITDAGVPCGPIYTLDKIFADPQVLHREMMVELKHPKAGKIKVTGNPVKLSDTPGEIKTSPPTLGQHTEEILTQLGYNRQDVDKMRQEKAL
jgi:crotonobetainyl-CoA:carnitine CoA-transferase CaiB-like acyl-CoA transferase